MTEKRNFQFFMKCYYIFQSYTECQCISSMSSNGSSVSVTNCKPNGCNRQLIIFLVVVFVGAAIGGSSLTPILMVILRYVNYITNLGNQIIMRVWMGGGLVFTIH